MDGFETAAARTAATGAGRSPHVVSELGRGEQSRVLGGQAREFDKLLLGTACRFTRKWEGTWVQGVQWSRAEEPRSRTTGVVGRED